MTSAKRSSRPRSQRSRPPKAAGGGGVFISYRREDSSGYALILYDWLTPVFGRNAVFWDIEGMRPGRDWVAALEREVGSCAALLALIGQRWLTAADEQGQLRLRDADDFVRREIATGLQRKIRVVPVLVGGARMPSARDLPRPLKPLARQQALAFTDGHAHQDFDTLVAALRDVVGPPGRGDRQAARRLESPIIERIQWLVERQVQRIPARAVELIREGKPDRAVDEIREGYELLMALLELAPGDLHLGVHLGYLHKTLGQAYERAGDLARASRHLDLAGSVFARVMTEIPADEKAASDLASAVNGLGNIYFQRGDLEKAIDSYRRAVTLMPDYAYAWHDLFGAYDALARRGEVDLPALREALAHLKATGPGLPGLSAEYVRQLDQRLAYWETQR